MNPGQDTFYWFTGIGLVLGLIWIWIFQISNDIERKQRLLRPFMYGGAVLFAAFTMYVTRDLKATLIVIPAVILVTWLNLRNIKVCGACGKLLHNRALFSRMEFCSKCGAPLNEDSPRSRLR
jgi:hypothetical protein